MSDINLIDNVFTVEDLENDVYTVGEKLVELDGKVNVLDGIDIIVDGNTQDILNNETQIDLNITGINNNANNINSIFEEINTENAIVTQNLERTLTTMTIPVLPNLRNSLIYDLLATPSLYEDEINNENVNGGYNNILKSIDKSYNLQTHFTFNNTNNANIDANVTISHYISNITGSSLIVSKTYTVPKGETLTSNYQIDILNTVANSVISSTYAVDINNITIVGDMQIKTNYTVGSGSVTVEQDTDHITDLSNYVGSNLTATLNTIKSNITDLTPIVTGITCLASEWIPATNGIYNYAVTKSFPGLENSTVELYNDDAISFGNYGFAIGDINPMAITFYAVNEVDTDNVLTLEIR